MYSVHDKFLQINFKPHYMHIGSYTTVGQLSKMKDPNNDWIDKEPKS